MEDVLDRLNTALAGRYTIEHEIGSGGMATVYRAQDLRHHRPVAVKVLRPELAAVLGPARFLREIEIAANLTHPHILPLHDSGEAAGLLFYVMPFVQGESLRDRLTRDGALPIPDAVRVLHDVADALAYAHDHNVVHRDIKPDNVMLAGRHATVTDFGIAKAVSDAASSATITSAGVSIGTPAYMAPEQCAAGPNVDHRADLYAFGVLAYEILAGRLPFTGPTAQAILAAHVMEAPAPLQEVRRDVPGSLAAVVMRCLEKNPADRWQSAGEILTRLESMASPTGAAIAPAPARFRLARKLAMAGTAVVVLAAAVFGLRRSARVHWVRERAIPQILQLADSGRLDSAYALARQASAMLPHDTVLRRLWPRFAQAVSFQTEPRGA